MAAEFAGFFARGCPQMVRQTFIGDDGVPIRSVIHPREWIAAVR
jgi:hypothetical protein